MNLFYFKMLKKIFYCILSCLFISMFPLTALGMDFTADISETFLNTNFTGKIFVKGDRYKVSIAPSGAEQEGNMTVIVDLKKGKTILIPMRSGKPEEFENFSIQAYMVDPLQTVKNLEKTTEKKIAGEETVNGFLCRHYAYYDKDFKLADVWYSKDLGPFPVKAHIVSGRNDGNINVKSNIGDTKIELNNIRIETVDESIFALPSGAESMEVDQKDKQEVPAVTSVLNGNSPWGRRIAKGGEIRVKTDPGRPVKISLKYLTDDAVCSYTAIPKGKTLEEVESIEKKSPEKGNFRKVKFSKNKKIEQVNVRVSEGTIFIKVENEMDPFAFSRDKKLEDGYLIAKEVKGISTEPDRKLTVSVTGDNQDGPDSAFNLICYQKQYDEKVFEKKLTIPNGKTETWEFSPDERIRTIELCVGESGSIKYRVEQPAL
jgi:hypothetical protein